MQVQMREPAMPAAKHEEYGPKIKAKEDAPSGRDFFASVLACAQNMEEQHPCSKDLSSLPGPDQENHFLTVLLSPVLQDLQLAPGEKARLPSHPAGRIWYGQQSPGFAGRLAGELALGQVQGVAGEINAKKVELFLKEPGAGRIAKEAIPLMQRQEVNHAAVIAPAFTGPEAKLVDLSQLARVKLFEPGTVAGTKDSLEAGQANFLSLSQGETLSPSLVRPAVSTQFPYLHALSYQLVDRAKLAVSEGRSELEIQLKPEHLGRLKLSLTLEDGVVTARFVVENSRVGQLIETNLTHLRTVLSEAGLRFEEASVNVGGEAFSGFDQGEEAYYAKDAGALIKQDAEDFIVPGQVAGAGINLLA